MPNILITGGGAPGIVGTIYALKKGDPDIRIITADIKDNVVGKYISDAFYLIPKPDNIHFIERIEEIVDKEEIDVILPQVEDELSVLSCHNFGIPVVVSSPETIRLSGNKQELSFVAEVLDIPLPRFMVATDKESFIIAAEELGYPDKKVVVKPPQSSGMRGFRILSDRPWDSKRFIEEKPNRVEITLEGFLDIFDKDLPKLMLMEDLPGDEYTVDCFRGRGGFVAIPRLRENIRTGITFDTKVVLDNKLIKYSRELANRLDLKYCFGFQFKCDNKGLPRLIECNPRVQGTMVVSMFGGFNIIYNSVREALDMDVDMENINLKEISFRRYWGGIAVDGDKIEEIHGIF